MSKRKTSRKKILYRTTAAIAILNVMVWSLVAFQELYRNRIMPGTSYAGIAIGGKTITEAKLLVYNQQAQLLKQPIKIIVDEITAQTTPAALGASVDEIELVNVLTERTKPKYLLDKLTAKASDNLSVIQFDQVQLETFATDLKTQVDRPAKDAGLTFENSTLIETPAVDGRSLDIPAAMATITHSLNTSIENKISLPSTITKAKLTESSQLEPAKSNLTQLLSQPFTLAADGKTVTLQPNEIFELLSFGVSNDVLGYDIDQEKATKHIEALAKKVYVAPITKQVSAAGSVLIEGKDGKQLNKVDAYKTLSAAIISPNSPTVTLAMSDIKRKTTTDSGDFYDLNRMGGKYIDISLSKQRIALIENNQLVKIYAVSTGKWSTPTPTGEFTIINHISTARSSLFPDLLMDDWLGLSGPGVRDSEYGLHRLPRYVNGSWIEDPAHIGKPLSHGCIRLAPGESTEVYNWAVNGTKVVIHT